MKHVDTAMAVFVNWFDSRKIYSGKYPAKGTMGGALHVLELLKADYNLDINAFLTQGGTQIARFGRTATRRILCQFGENRDLIKEGRTNRGLVSDMQSLLEALKDAHLEDVPAQQRNEAIHAMQALVAQKITDFLNQGGLPFEYDPTQSSEKCIEALVTLARSKQKDGPVAQHLVGAKLQLRYPDLEIENHCSSTADDQLGRLGDFQVHDTVFHVSVSPNAGHWNKCAANLRRGIRVYLLVPNRILQGQKDMAEEAYGGKVAVFSIEGFVGQNIDELSIFSRSGQTAYMRRLLELYNERVDAVETDKSLMIEIPDNL